VGEVLDEVEGVGHVGDEEHLQEGVVLDVARVYHLEQVAGRVGDELLDLRKQSSEN